MSGIGFPINQQITIATPGGMETAASHAPSAVAQVELPQVAPAVKQEPVIVEHGNIRASFSYDQNMKQVIITLSSEDTGETLQQIPSEKVLRLLAGFAESLGQMIDVKG